MAGLSLGESRPLAENPDGLEGLGLVTQGAAAAERRRIRADDAAVSNVAIDRA